MTMEKYFVDVYLRRHRLTVGTRSTMLAAVRKFDAFAGRIRRLDESTIDRFRKWLVSRGHSSTQSYSTRAKVVARDWFPRGPWLRPLAFLDADTPGTLEYVFVCQYAPRRGRRVTDADTRRRYGSTLRLFSEYLKRAAKPSDLTKRRVKAFLTWLLKEQRIADFTAAHHAQRLCSLWNWAHRAGMVPQSP